MLNALLWLLAVIVGGAIYDALKYGAKYFGKIFPPVKRFHQNLFTLRDRAVSNLQFSYDFYARAFSFALLFGMLALGFCIDIGHLYHSSAYSPSNEIWYYFDLIAITVCTYIASLWIGSVVFITKKRLDLFHQQMPSSEPNDAPDGNTINTGPSQ